MVQFYERRARRILPALALVTAITIAFAWAWLLPEDLDAFARSVLGVSTFSSSIAFWRESGYFDTAVELKPLLQTWSLAVEEQSYIFFPLLLMAVWRFPRRIAIVILSLSFIVSRAIAIWGVTNKPDAAFYLLPTRAWELLVGVGCAFLLSPSAPTYGGVTSSLALAGIVMLFYAITTVDASTPVPGLPILVPIMGTALIILFARPGMATHTFLSWPPFVAVGLVSYSAHLWHQPVFAFARHRFDPHLAVATFAICLALTAGLAWLTWAIVERPFRRPDFLDRRGVFRTSAGALFAMALVGTVGTANLFGVRDVFFEDIYAEQATCRPSSMQATEAMPDGEPVVLWGDSYADALAGELRESLAASGRRLELFDLHACQPILGTIRNRPADYDGNFGATCHAHNTAAMKAVCAMARNERPPKYVVLTMHFTLALEGKGADGRPAVLDANDATLDPLIHVPLHGRETTLALIGLG